MGGVTVVGNRVGAGMLAKDETNGLVVEAVAFFDFKTPFTLILADLPVKTRVGNLVVAKLVLKGGIGGIG